MARVEFRAKPETIYNSDGTAVAYVRVKVPALNRRHCDMAAFRCHVYYGSYANSDFFASVLHTALKKMGIREYLRMDQLPNGVAVDASGFLAVVTIDL